MSIITDRTTGLEQIARQTLLVLHASLNAEIGVQMSLWAPRDQDFAAALGRAYSPITIETVDNDNFVPGHRPSLIDAPLGNYPNVSVYARNARRSPYQLDQFHGVTVTVLIEAMVKSGDYGTEDTSGVGEELVDSRINRTTDAIVSVLAANRSLNGFVSDIDDPPSVSLSDPFVRAELNSRWFWQGSRIELVIHKSQKAL